MCNASHYLVVMFGSWFISYAYLQAESLLCCYHVNLNKSMAELTETMMSTEYKQMWEMKKNGGDIQILLSPRILRGCVTH